MAHELKTDGVSQVSFMEFSPTGKRLAWHGLGQVLQTPPDSATAIVQAGLDWEVVQKVLAHKVGDSYLELPGTIGNFRNDTQTLLGVVKGRYTPVQNRECFSFLDSLHADGILRYETAGALGEGERIFMTAQVAGDWQVGGDDIAQYLLCFNSHDGSSSLEIIPTAVRVVCANTLAIARKGKGFKMKHTNNVQERMKLAAKMFEACNKDMALWVETQNKMAETDFSTDDFKRLIAALYPIEDNMTKLAKERAEEKRIALYGIWAGEKTQPKNNKSAWAALNAVTFFEDHSEDHILKGNVQESRFNRSIEGQGNEVKQKAQNLIAELVR